MKSREIVYMVQYTDDDNKKHITFVKGFSAVRFLEDRFGTIYFEKTENCQLIAIQSYEG